MKLIDKAKAHFDSLKIKEIKVPEWTEDGEETLTIYSKPLTLAEMSKLQRYAQDSDVELMAYCLIYKALDAEGIKLFDVADKNHLMNRVDKDVLTRVATEIMATPTIEEQLKK